MNKKIKHLEMIQDVIKRMASNSFALKGWAVTLTAAIFALSGKENDKLYFVVAFIPIVLFWFLDSYYLKQERLYRSLYDCVREINENNNEIDFSMKATTEKFHSRKNKYFYCLFSQTEWLFYFPLALCCVGVIFMRCYLNVCAVSAG